MLNEWGVSVLVGFSLFLIIGWFTGDKEYGRGSKTNDERSRFIKQKAIAGSWIFLLTVFVINVILNFFDLRTGPLKNAPFNHPELFYLLLLVGSYFVCYWMYSKRISGKRE